MTPVATITADKLNTGWTVKLNLHEHVAGLTTQADRAALLEKIACTASANAAVIRQRISAGADE